MNQSTKKQLLVRLAVLSLGLLFLNGCGGMQNSQWVGDTLITLYPVPPSLQPGEVQVAVRMQNRDFQIVTDRPGQLELIEMQSGQQEIVVLKPGPGRDLRGWGRFPKPGLYTAVFSFPDESGNTLTARFNLEVPKGR